MPEAAIFTFKIDFARGQGDPRRVFDAASLLIDGFEELDGTVAASVDSKLKAGLVLEDIQPGSLRVILKTVLEDIDEQALKDGEYKKAIGPALVRAKRLAVEALDRPEDQAKEAVHDLRENLQKVVAETDVKHLPAYAPIHEGRLVAALDKIQGGKRTLGPNDKMTVETEEGTSYEVDLTKRWEPAEIIPVSDTTEKHSEGTVILTIRKPDLLGDSKWQFTHGTSIVYASIQDERWVGRLRAGKIALHSGDALRCKVRFTYVFDDKGTIIEQKTDILKVTRLIRGPGHQTSMFDD
jgi:hypothetical protein